MGGCFSRSASTVVQPVDLHPVQPHVPPVVRKPNCRASSSNLTATAPTLFTYRRRLGESEPLPTRSLPASPVRHIRSVDDLLVHHKAILQEVVRVGWLGLGTGQHCRVFEFFRLHSRVVESPMRRYDDWPPSPRPSEGRPRRNPRLAPADHYSSDRGTAGWHATSYSAHEFLLRGYVDFDGDVTGDARNERAVDSLLKRQRPSLDTVLGDSTLNVCAPGEDDDKDEHDPPSQRGESNNFNSSTVQNLASMSSFGSSMSMHASWGSGLLDTWCIDEDSVLFRHVLVTLALRTRAWKKAFTPPLVGLDALVFVVDLLLYKVACPGKPERNALQEAMEFAIEITQEVEEADHHQTLLFLLINTQRFGDSLLDVPLKRQFRGYTGDNSAHDALAFIKHEVVQGQAWSDNTTVLVLAPDRVDASIVQAVTTAARGEDTVVGSAQARSPAARGMLAPRVRIVEEDEEEEEKGVH